MSNAPVDHDLLARFVGGALDDTPDGTAVAELIATDSAWTEAHDRLVLALDAVAADLAAFAAVAEPMPDDVAARLDRVIADAPRGGLTVVPGSRPTTASRRRRVPKWLAPVTVAAGLIAFGGFWLNQSGGLPTGGQNDSGDSAGGSDTSAEASGAGILPQRQEASGTRYDVDQFSTKTGEPDGTDRSSANASPQIMGAQPPPVLLRLTDPQALASCLDAIEAAHGVAIAATTAVDYAFWQNEPALMVFFTDVNGERWTWAAGPDCGASGPDTRYEARVA